MSKIKLKNSNDFVLVDSKDHANLSKYNWFKSVGKNSKTIYAVRNKRLGVNDRSSVKMHREILGAKKGFLDILNGLKNKDLFWFNMSCR